MRLRCMLGLLSSPPINSHPLDSQASPMTTPTILCYSRLELEMDWISATILANVSAHSSVAVATASALDVVVAAVWCAFQRNDDPNWCSVENTFRKCHKYS